MNSAPRLRSLVAVASAATVLAIATGGAALARPIAGTEAAAVDVATGAARTAADVATGAARTAADVAHAPAPAAAVPAEAQQAVASSVVCEVLGELPLCTHGDDAHLVEAEDKRDSTRTASSSSSSRIGCYRTGPRVQAVYARPANAQDRFSASLPSFQKWAGGVEKAVDDSARKTGGNRHVRFASVPSGSSCTLSVLRVTLPAEAFSSFSATVSALQDIGLDKQDVKYLVWSDATGYCGIASTYLDDVAGQENLNNGRYPSYARVDRRCWGYAETHELMHMLGAVQRSAPHATHGLHCSDGKDVMCYDDGTRGSRQTSACDASHSRLLDCRNDDYFSTAPPARSWLASHWNTAASAFLARGWTDPAPAPAPPASAQPAPKPSATPSPRPTASSGPLPRGLPSPPVPLPTPLLP